MMFRDDFISCFVDGVYDFFGVRLTSGFVVVVVVSAAAVSVAAVFAAVVIVLIVLPVMMVVGPVLVAFS